LAGIRKGEPSKRVPIHGPFPIGAAGGSIMKVKVFTGHGDAIVLEGEVNEWLEKNSYITIKNIRQNSVFSGEQLFTLMSVWYDN
jgi:hypothetical protein